MSDYWTISAIHIRLSFLCCYIVSCDFRRSRGYKYMALWLGILEHVWACSLVLTAAGLFLGTHCNLEHIQVTVT